jgi:hypothetical protein
MKPRSAAVWLAAGALLAGCSRVDPDKAKAELLAADRAFCAASVKDGPKAAFLAGIARDGKILSDAQTGADAVRDTYMQFPSNATLTWEPSFVDVASSGDLGYTWGRYRLMLPVAGGKAPPILRMGTYVTIWKRQADGSWKFVLDGGNPDGS